MKASSNNFNKLNNEWLCCQNPPLPPPIDHFITGNATKFTTRMKESIQKRIESCKERDRKPSPSPLQGEIFHYVFNSFHSKGYFTSTTRQACAPPLWASCNVFLKFKLST